MFWSRVSIFTKLVIFTTVINIPYFVNIVQPGLEPIPLTFKLLLPLTPNLEGTGWWKAQCLPQR